MTMRRLTAILLLMLFYPLSALGDGTLSLMGLEADGSGRDWSESLFFSRMEKETGVTFTLVQYDDAATYEAAKTEAFLSGDLPDVLFKAALSPWEEMQYGPDSQQKGQLVDLAPYLAEYAPNLSQILISRPDWAGIITQPDGKITALPALSGADRQCILWINQDWLTSLGLPMPTTLAEYTETLRAFRDGDPNGNGKADEIPLSLVGPFEAKFMLHAFGIVANDYNLYVDEEGQVRFAPLEEGYEDFLAWLHMALNESLIDPLAFRQSQGSRTTSATTDQDVPVFYGGMVTIAPYTLVDMDKTLAYVALPPLSHEGKRAYRMFLSGVTRGTFAITNTCQDIPAALRFVDYLYTEEGGRLAFAGLVGEDYTLLPGGDWRWTEEDDVARLSDILSYSIITAGDGNTPGLEPAAFMRRSEIAADNHTRRQTDLIRPYLVMPFPITWPTDMEREERIDALQRELAACVDRAIANFAMGIVPIDGEHIAAFHEELKALGVEEFIALWQAIYEEQG